MSVRTETLQLRVLIDGSPARKELATLDQEYAKINSGLKNLTKGTKEYVAATERLDAIRVRQGELRQEIGLTSLTAKQLGDELRRLQVIQRNLTPNTEMWAANAARINEVKARLKELNDVNAQAAAAWEQQRKQIRLTDMTMAQLDQEARRLRAVLETTHPNTNEFRAYSTALHQVEERKRQLTNTAGGFGRMMQNIKGQVVGAFAVLGTFLGSTMLVSGFRNLVLGAGALSDELADVEKATGLTRAQVRELNKDLSRIDTRTANAELRNIAVGLGQAGEDATAAAVAAVDKINVALGDEFGESAKEITTTLSTLRNNLGDIKSGDYASDVGRIGNALNLLGANGLATAPVVSDITNRVAGAAQTFGIASGKVLGLAATFQELGINTERGSTAYVRVLQKIASEPEKFARIVRAAGLDVDLFRRQVNDDLQAAFVTVANAARIAGTSNTAYAAALGEMETEGIGVSELLSKIGANQDLLAAKSKLATDALKDQASITEEFNKKNTTFGAQLDKLSKNWDSLTARIVSGDHALSGFFERATKGINLMVEELREAKSAFDFFTILVDPSAALRQRAERFQAERTADPFAVEKKSLGELEKRYDKLLELRDSFLKAGKTEAAREGDTEMRALRDRIDALRANAAKEQQQTDPYALEKLSLQELKARLAELAALRKEIAVAGFDPNNADGEIAAVQSRIKEMNTTAAGPAREPDKRMVEELESTRKAMLAARRQLELDALSADEREIAQIDEKYATMREKLTENEQHTAEDLRKLDALHADERTNAIAEQGARRIALAQEIAEKSAKAEQEAMDKVFVDQLGQEDLEIVQQMQRMEQLVALYEEAGVDTRNVVEKTEKAIAEIRKKYRDKEQKDATALRQQAIQNQIAIYQGVGAALSGVNALLAATYSAQLENNYKNTVGAKALGLAQIAIASAVGVAGAIKAGADVPWPGNLAAIASGVGAVLSGIASAITLMRDVPKPDTSMESPSPTSTGGGPRNIPLGAKGGIFEGPSHANGGLKVYDPIAKRVVAEVEGDEPWMVLSKVFREKNADIIPRLLRASASGERLNLANTGGIFAPTPRFNFAKASESMSIVHMAQGGVYTGPMGAGLTGKPVTRGTALVNNRAYDDGSDATGSKNAATDRFAAAVEQFNQVVRNFPTEVRAKSVLQDEDRRRSEHDLILQETGVRKAS